MTERTLRISARMAEEIQQWASDELSQWPRDTAYAADLENLLSQLTAAAPAPDAVAERGVRALLLAGCDLLAIESEALRNSIRIVGDPDQLSDAPEDAHAVEAIREIEDWIASVKATMTVHDTARTADRGE